MSAETVSPQLFLCHSHADAPFVRQLSTDLNDVGIRVWLDKWELRVGDSLHECIGAALEDAAFVGVVLSPDSVESRWCQAELDQALTREKRTGNKVVLPLIHRQVKLPPFLEGRLYLDFSDSYFNALARLACAVFGTDVRLLEDALQKTPPANITEVQQILASARVTDVLRLLSADKFDNIMLSLVDAGIDARGSRIRVYPDEWSRVATLTCRSPLASDEVDSHNPYDEELPQEDDDFNNGIPKTDST